MVTGIQHMAAPARRVHRAPAAVAGRTAAPGLAARLRHLPWPDRLAELDREVWRRAQRALDAAEITRVINRERPHRPARVRRFARRTAALLGDLASRFEAEERVPATPLRALLALPRGERGLLDPHDLLDGRPGLAFFVLAGARGDSAVTFAARAAFFRALTGEAG